MYTFAKPPNIRMTQQDLIDLIANGQVEQALDELILLTDEAIVPKSNFISAQRRYNQNLMDSREFMQAQSKASESALYLIKRYAPLGKTVDKESNRPSITSLVPPKKNKTQVFLSYNHNDSAITDTIQQHLAENGFSVLRDQIDMAAGEEIQDFIDRMIKSGGFVLSVVSRNSLSSGWVGIESNLAHYAQYFGLSRFIPVMIDNALFDEQLVFDVVTNLDTKMQQIEANILKSKELRIPYDQFETKRKRLEELRHNLPKIINRLQGTLVVDVSDEKFAEGMKKVVSTLNAGL
jgi:hypothetical protein